MKRLLQDVVLWATDRQEQFFRRLIHHTDQFLNWAYEKTI